MLFHLALVVAPEKPWASAGKPIHAQTLMCGESEPHFLVELVELPMPELRKDYRTLFVAEAMISHTP